MATDAGLKRKVGPLSVGAWGGVAAATIGVLYVIRRRAASKAGSAAATGLTGGGTIPAAGAITSTIGNGSGSAYASTADYLAAIVPIITQAAKQQNPGARNSLNEAWSYTQATRWLMNGQCVGARGYKAIGAAIATTGLPPGANAPLTICTNSSGAPVSEKTAIGQGR